MRGDCLKPFDENGAFQAAPERERLDRLAIRGAGITVFLGGVGLAIQVIATVILARLVTPRDFGLVAMVTTFSLLLTNFGLNGFTEAVLQREEIDDALASNLFWINLASGFLLTAGFAAAGSVLARIYKDPFVTVIAIGISPAIFFTSASVIHLALLKRGMHFYAVSANDVLARAISVTLSILLGWGGYGHWALVAAVVMQPLAGSIGAWFLCRWIPRPPRRAAGTSSMVSFALTTYGRFTVNYFTRNVDNLLVGGYFGAALLGYYKKAYDLFALSVSQLTSPLTNVAVSALSRLNPHSIQYRDFFLRALSVMAFVGMGLSADFTLVGQDLIRLLLGPGWEPAGRIFVFFGPGIGFMILYYMHGWIHLSIGRADRWFLWGLIEAVATCLLFIMALPWGPMGIAIAWSTSFMILMIPSFWFAGKPIQFGIKPMISAVWKYVLASLLASCACARIMHALPPLGVLPGEAEFLERILTNSLLFGVLYLIAVVLLYRGCSPIYQVALLLREMAPSFRQNQVLTETCYPDTPEEFISQTVNSKPMVSILIPAFNAQELIAETIRSAIAQTWEPKEIIVIDDGSTDQTLAIARQFESDCVHIFTQKNQGAAATRNRAFGLSRGDYIQWLDADDLLEPDKIAKQIEVLNKHKSERTLLSSAFGRFRYRYYRAEFVPTALWHDLSPVEWLLRKLGGNIFMQTATWLVSRKLSDAAGLWNTALLGDDDGEYFARVVIASDGVRFAPESKVYYRAPWPNTLSCIGHSNLKIDAQWRSMQLQIGYLRSLEDSERARDACMRYLQDWLICFYPERHDIIKQAEQMAEDMGRQLEPPHLHWKYSWIKTVLGWLLVKRLQIILPGIRWTVTKFWDKVLYTVDNRFRQLEIHPLKNPACRRQLHSKPITSQFTSKQT